MQDLVVVCLEQLEVYLPLFKSIGFIPAATYLQPSLAIACAKTVAVVVPSGLTHDNVLFRLTSDNF